MVNLNKIKLGFSPLSEEIFLYRHGKDEGEVLDKRKAEEDVMRVITTMMMYDAPKGATKTYRFGSQQYELSLKLIKKP